MNYTKREDFVKKTNAKIFVINKFIETLNELKNSDLVKTFNGKCITKRFTDKVNPTLPKGMTIEIKKEDYFDKFNIHIYFNRYGDADVLETISDPNLKRDIRNLSYDDCEDKIYQHEPNKYSPADGKYLLGDRTFRHPQFVYAIDKRIEILVNYVKELQQAVDEVEIIYQKYEDLKKHVNEVLDTIPLVLRQFVNIQNPLY